MSDKKKTVQNFALIGAAGYIAPRHLKAIHDTGNRLVAATDPHDSVGVLDQYSHEVRFFPEIERFDRQLEKLRRGPEAGRVDWVSVCSPNYLHDAHIRLALRVGANALCEKPLVINPWNLDALEELEQEYERSINTVLQLRVHPALVELRQRLIADGPPASKHDVVLTYVATRGAWYDVSWKGQPEKSGGVAVNIGIHFFDLLLWLFGPAQRVELHVSEQRRMAGYIELRDANIRWFLSVDEGDLPPGARAAGQPTHRSITIDGQELEFTGGFADLHTKVYEQTLAGQGFGIGEARRSIELVYKIRTAEVQQSDGVHPLVA